MKIFASGQNFHFLISSKNGKVLIEDIWLFYAMEYKF